MGRLSTFERLRVIEIYSKFNKFGFGNKCKAVSQYAKEKDIDISESGVRLIMEKWETTSILLYNKLIFEISNLAFFNLQFLTKRKSWRFAQAK